MPWVARKLTNPQREVASRLLAAFPHPSGLLRVRHPAIIPMARRLGVSEDEVEQACRVAVARAVASFRGDPEDPAARLRWLACLTGWMRAEVLDEMRRLRHGTARHPTAVAAGVPGGAIERGTPTAFLGETSRERRNRLARCRWAAARLPPNGGA